MRKRLLLAALGAVTIISLPVAGIGCGNRVELNTDKVRQFADPIVEEMLRAASAGDFSSYSMYFDDTMKAAVTDYSFSANNSMMKLKIGDYLHKEFRETRTEGDAIVIYYNAKYTLEPEAVEVRIVFKEISGEMYVTGINLDSPLLRE